jgi:DNA polymerase-4
MKRERSILHVDMDAFYAAVEARDDPALAGKPLIVGGTGGRGVVAAASYEARRYGIRSAMPVREALRRCPDLLRVRPRMEVYRRESARIFAILRDYTPLVEGLSLDEAFLDVTDSRRLFGTPADIAATVKRRIREATALTASVGVAPNKLVAKIASDLDKPDGLCVVAAEDLARVLDPLPVSVLPGLGPKTLPALRRLGITTLGDLRRAPPKHLQPVLGRYAERIRSRAAGIDDRPVTPDHDDKSISAEETFDTDLETAAEIRRELAKLADRTASRLRRKGLSAGTVKVKVRESDFTTHSRQVRLDGPRQSTRAILDAAVALVGRWLDEHPDYRIRLLGVGVTGLVSTDQPDLFGGVVENPRLDRVTDAVRERFGAPALVRGRLVPPKPPRS